MTGTANTYADGYAYGRKIGAHMAPWRRQENDRHIRRSEYSTRGWDTRGYWLGVRRALRSF